MRLSSLVSLLVPAAMLTSCGPPPAPTNSAADSAAVKQMLVDWYAAYSTTDEARYKAFLVEEYVLLENGAIMGLEDDLKNMRGRPPGYRRKDAFDFRSVRLHGDLAYATYFLESEMADDTKIRATQVAGECRPAPRGWTVALRAPALDARLRHRYAAAGARIDEAGGLIPGPMTAAQRNAGSGAPASAKPLARSTQLSQRPHGPPSGRGS